MDKYKKDIFNILRTNSPEMWKTVLFLIFTLVVVPIVTFYFDDAPSELQWSLLDNTYTVCLLFAFLCFVVSTLTKNYSQVDKLWSILPLVYVWMVYASSPDPRILMISVLVSVWGIRLSYNFWRRGGYQWKFWEGDEDYRWAILRAKPEFQPQWKWILFNLFFISLYQMSLIWMMTIPTIKSTDGHVLHVWDYLLTAIALGILVLETIADQQQWVFQQEKYRRIKEGEELGSFYGKGFTHTGLWGRMRHPNYFAELSFLVVIYLFSVSASGQWINWSIAGCLLLILLFKGSSDFSEEISASKYPEYKEYQKKVPRFLPRLW